MNNVNFLPQSYRQRLRRHHRYVREGMLVAGVAIAAVMWAGYLRTDVSILREETRWIEDSLADAIDRDAQIKTLTQERETLKEARRLRHELEPPLKQHQLIDTLASLMPTSIALEGLTLTNRRPSPAAYEPPLPPGTATRPVVLKKPAAAAEVKDYTLVELEGLAPDDLAIAELIVNLSEHPLFEQVKLGSSRHTDERGVAARHFTLTLQVDLRNRFTWHDPKTPQPAALAETPEVRDAVSH